MSQSRTYVVSGSASGIGAAVSARLRDEGHTVIGVDIRDADVTHDLSSDEGRDAAAEEIRTLTDHVDGVVPCAGIAGLTGVDPELLVSLNFFGAVGLVTRLRPLMGEGASVVLISSNSVTAQPGWNSDVAAACLKGDEQAARKLAARGGPVQVYPATKAALAYWARREGIRSDWAGAGIRINTVAPGLIATPMTEQLRKDPVLGLLGNAYPTALNRPGQPEEIAALVAFLLSEEASLMVGSVVFADGGTDALLHPLRPAGMNVPKLVLGAMDAFNTGLQRLKLFLPG